MPEVFHLAASKDYLSIPREDGTLRDYLPTKIMDVVTHLLLDHIPAILSRDGAERIPLHEVQLLYVLFGLIRVMPQSNGLRILAENEMRTLGQCIQEILDTREGTIFDGRIVSSHDPLRHLVSIMEQYGLPIGMDPRAHPSPYPDPPILEEPILIEPGAFERCKDLNEIFEALDARLRH